MTLVPAAGLVDLSGAGSDATTPLTPGQRLVAKQFARARAQDGALDIDAMARLVAAAYDDADRDRRRSDRSISLMVDELAGLNAGLERIAEEQSAALVKAETRYRDLIENAVIGVYRSTLDGVQLFANPALVRLNGFDSVDEMLACTQDIARQWYVDPTRRVEFVRQIELHGRVDDFVSEVFRYKSRERIWVSETAWVVRDEEGNPVCFEGTVIEATDRILAERRMEHMALHDALTGLFNRAGFHRCLDHLWNEAPKAGPIGLICLDLDRFKEVNDTLGHAAGDVILRTVAQRLLGFHEPALSIARLGGDEFAIITRGAADPAALRRLAEMLIARLCDPIMVDQQTVVIGATAGIALNDGQAATADELLQNADIALYRAKSAGRGRACLFEAQMGEALRQRRQIEIDLRSAIMQNEFFLNYQPIVSAASGHRVGCEALLRWRHNDQIVSPADFIPIAEETGLMIPIGEWVVREACMEAARWPEDISIAVNLSPVQFRSPGLLPSIIQALACSGLDPKRLELEITETVMMADDRNTWLTLRGLRRLGVRVALDDFGVGHSSLSYLHRFRFDKIKIDRSFVSSIGTDPVNCAIVRAVIRLGQELGIAIVAEGVETTGQADALRAENCPLFQGYLFGRPMHAAALGFAGKENQPSDRASEAIPLIRPAPERDSALAGSPDISEPRRAAHRR
jgi:diguanylate cyclase (GGDEF)-like protein/PAS domain S-box-containing protein